MKILMAMCGLIAAIPLAAQQSPAPSTVARPASPAATAIAAKLLPNGTYRQMMGGSFRQMLGGMTDDIGSMPIGPMLRAAGLSEGDAKRMDKATLGEIMEILDPDYRERTRRMTDAMFDAMIPLMEQMEPDLRAGLALALDSRFSPGQLADISTFFATPTGGTYAAQQMSLYTDPAMMSRMQSFTSKLMAAMPDLMAKAAKATGDLPSPKKAKDLTPAEREKLARLLGVDPATLNQQ